MLSDKKILVTGPAGQIAKPLAAYLAKDNEVWGIARFSKTETQSEVDDLGVTTLAIDLETGSFDPLPDDFDYVLHLAAYREEGDDFDTALRVNAEGTGLLMQHCRHAKAILVMSTHAIYRPHEDPMYVYRETDPLGDANPPYARTYSISKIAQEVVARYCARALNVPTVIARMNASYGPNGGRPMRDVETVIAGDTVHPKWDPLPYCPIAQDDINRQIEALLDSASVPALTVNWGGDEVVTTQEWLEYLCDLLGIEPLIETKPFPGTQRGLISDNALRTSITGPCGVSWKTGMLEAVAARHPEKFARE
jgi:nucleoside-diphosphate-sugar epimerase